jgi:large subunit ribosomal protein L25
MAEVVLEVAKRDQTGKNKVNKLRDEGRIPAIVYGAQRDAVSIVVDRKAISDLVTKSDHGIRSIFLLKMTGTDQQRHAMIKDIQIDPISRRMIHVDFIRVKMDEVVRVTVPIHLNGTPVGLKDGGIVEFQVRDLHVEVLPNAIPDSVEVDVSNLGIHDYIRISDLTIPEGVKVLDDPERVVVGVGVPRAEETPEETAAAATTELAEPEVIKKGKIEEEGEGEAEPEPQPRKSEPKK